MFDLSKLTVQLVASGLVVVGGVSACVIRDASRDRVARAEARAETRKATADASKSAVKKQAAVPVAGAANRLRSEFCPDCGKP